MTPAALDAPYGWLERHSAVLVCRRSPTRAVVADQAQPDHLGATAGANERRGPRGAGIADEVDLAGLNLVWEVFNRLGEHRPAKSVGDPSAKAEEQGH